MAKQVVATFIEEDCTIEHEGRKFTSGGAVVTGKFIQAYLGKNGVLTDCMGMLAVSGRFFQVGLFKVISQIVCTRLLATLTVCVTSVAAVVRECALMRSARHVKHDTLVPLTRSVGDGRIK